MHIINSTKNPLIKLVKSLHLRKNRYRENLFIIEGQRACEQIFTSDFIPKNIFITKNLTDDRKFLEFEEKMKIHINRLYNFYKENIPQKLDPHLEFIYESIKEHNLDKLICVVDDKVFSEISDTKSPQGILMIVEIMPKNLEDLSATISKNKVQKNFPCTCMILDRVQDPGNLGTILRTAEAMGVDGVILTKDCVDIYSPKVVRSSMGALFTLNFACEISYEEIASWLEKSNFKAYATVLDDKSSPIWNVKFKDDIAICFGNEATGISDKLQNIIKETIYIPIVGKAESLNVATAVAMSLYEIYRQQIDTLNK